MNKIQMEGFSGYSYSNRSLEPTEKKIQDHSLQTIWKLYVSIFFGQPRLFLATPIFFTLSAGDNLLTRATKVRTRDFVQA